MRQSSPSMIITACPDVKSVPKAILRANACTVKFILPSPSEVFASPERPLLPRSVSHWGFCRDSDTGSKSRPCETLPAP